MLLTSITFLISLDHFSNQRKTISRSVSISVRINFPSRCISRGCIFTWHLVHTTVIEPVSGHIHTLFKWTTIQMMIDVTSVYNCLWLHFIILSVLVLINCSYLIEYCITYSFIWFLYIYELLVLHLYFYCLLYISWLQLLFIEFDMLIIIICTHYFLEQRFVITSIFYIYFVYITHTYCKRVN